MTLTSNVELGLVFRIFINSTGCVPLNVSYSVVKINIISYDVCRTVVSGFR